MNSYDLMNIKLPGPLDKDELYSYFEKMNNGDMDARSIIIEHNILLVKSSIFNKFSNTSYEIEELFAIGLLGLIKAVDTFDMATNLNFSTYAVPCIDNEILMFIRDGKKRINDQSIDMPILTNIEGDEKTILDLLKDDKSDFTLDYENKVVYEDIRKMIDELPDREKKIIELYYGYNNDEIYNQYQLSIVFDLSQPQISRLIKMTSNKIGLQLIKKDLIETTKENKDKIKKKSLWY